MEEIDLSKKIRNSLQEIENMIEKGENVEKINIEKEKLHKMLDEYYKKMK